MKKRKALLFNLLSRTGDAQFLIENSEGLPLGPRRDDASQEADWESLPSSMRRDIEFSRVLDP